MNQESRHSVPSIDSQRLLDRFLQYVQVATAANPSTDHYPSSEGQFELGRILADSLREMGAESVEQDEHGLVWATIPATKPGAPTILFNSHLDTSPEAPGENVQPQVIEYSGGSIALPNGTEITVDSTPELEDLVGKTLVTTDGMTLLGGDDKAGVAIIMELAQVLIENPKITHGEVRILFTCDEEIGRGAKHFEAAKANATVGYTLDGGGVGVIDEECFSANAIEVTFKGNNIHPAIAKNRMVNAVRGAGVFLALLPRDRLSPESTDGREGFVHPHTIAGGVEEATVQIIVRDFDTDMLTRHEDMVRRVADEVTQQIPGLQYEVRVVDQYRNMADGIRTVPQAIDHAVAAFDDLGIEAKRDIIRGGTDGAQMTFMGLPTPNLSSGQYNIHSKHEFACLDEMAIAVQHAILLLQRWAQD